jgi:hypothetical protein
MLVLIGMSHETAKSGSQYMLIFHSARLPGMHYKVETDAGTVRRLREVVGTEVEALMAAAQSDDDEDEFRDPSNRF